jgi:hypothetical protein
MGLLRKFEQHEKLLVNGLKSLLAIVYLRPLILIDNVNVRSQVHHITFSRYCLIVCFLECVYIYIIFFSFIFYKRHLISLRSVSIIYKLFLTLTFKQCRNFRCKKTCLFFKIDSNLKVEFTRFFLFYFWDQLMICYLGQFKMQTLH